MKKYLGIDFGDTYIGLALAEGVGPALPYKVVKHDESLWPLLRQLFTDVAITDIVVGWPISLSGNENKRTVATEAFIEQLGHHTNLPIHRADERFSSAEATAKGMRGRVDAMAAAHFLQAFVDRHGERS